MERFTYKDDRKWRIRIGDVEYSGNWVDRLAAYEDTGLDPEDIKREFTEDTILKMAGAILGVAPDRLRELAQADREGRVYIEEKAYQCPKCGSHRLTPRVDGKFYFCFNCKEQFPKEAEASLRGAEV